MVRSAARITAISCSICFSATKRKAAPANIHLRRLGDCVETIPLLGPGSPASYDVDPRGLFGAGQWATSCSACDSCWPSPPPFGSGMWNWRTQVELRSPVISSHVGHRPAHYGAIRLNEFYVSQYVDPRRSHTRSTVAPWLRGRTSPWAGAARDGDRLTGPWRGVCHGRASIPRPGDTRRWKPIALSTGLFRQAPGSNISLVAIQDGPLFLAPGAKSTRDSSAGSSPTNKLRPRLTMPI